MRWYEGKACALCGKVLRAVRWFGNQPALMSPEGTTIETDGLSPEEIEKLLSTHRPVCWNCHLQKAFQRAKGV